MLNFCTLFDSSYIHYGLALYESLTKHCKHFHLYIYAFDEECYEYFILENLENVTVIKLEEFEDFKLKSVKPTRTKGEYCWTCTPSIIKYSLDNFNLESCVYVDADIYFFNDPNILIEEMGNNSVLITEHRYSPTYDLSSESGIYCVQFMVFKNDVRGNIALNWWRDKCIDWCYARHEDGKFGDQKYLDDWLTRFEGVHSLKNLGGGIAPWNIEQYNFFNFDNGPKAVEIVSGQIFDVIFYHYHSLKLYKHGITLLTSESYGITNNSFEIIYKDYINRLNSFLNILENSNIFFRSELKGNNIFISLFYFYFLQIKNIIKKFLNQNYGRSVFYSNYKIVK